MTFWYADDMSGWGWFGMTIGMVAFWALVVTAFVLVLRAAGRSHEHAHTPHPSAAATPQQILGERFARGEIDEEEYRRRLDTLHAGPPATP
ncbi:SHOCT domain-containing protein [Streptomyces sp. NPDC000348]|uniref:SHOCT domain-containing protein n=1 Tax=Streptomyces sp. NPDC000348 TaxID=3364538 RepID=UPI00369796BE